MLTVILVLNIIRVRVRVWYHSILRGSVHEVKHSHVTKCWQNGGWTTASYRMPYEHILFSDPFSKADACALETTPKSNGSVNDLYSPVYHLQEDPTTLYCYRVVSQ